jgi:hypothetical protein
MNNSSDPFLLLFLLHALVGRQAVPGERWPFSTLEIVPADRVTCSEHIAIFWENEEEGRGEMRKLEFLEAADQLSSPDYS